jgi:2-polyprenyl-3-methyl-5-hydroxy-6-metoxy-1,4-benzoquinol methylase
MADLSKNFVKKILAEDSETKFRAELHDIVPNSVFPEHRHTSEEWVYVLNGKLEDEFGEYSEGTFKINKKNSIHTPRSQTGCRLLVFRKDDYVLMTVCPICKSSKTNQWKKADAFLLLQCISCGLIFVDRSSYEDDPKLQYIYDDTSPTQYYCASAEIDKKNFSKILDAIETHLRLGVILDVGASVGTFLNLARRRGWTCFGVEPNKAAVQICEESGLQVVGGFFDENFAKNILEQRRQFDIIHMGDVLEHVFDPVAFLKTAYGLLRSGGYIAVVTPNIDHFLTRRYQIKPKEHLVYFNARSLRKALQLAGFSDIKIKPQTRLRSFANIEKGTTKTGLIEKIIIRFATFFIFEKILTVFLAVIGRDELFAIAKKS